MLLLVIWFGILNSISPVQFRTKNNGITAFSLSILEHVSPLVPSQELGRIGSGSGSGMDARR